MRDRNGWTCLHHALSLPDPGPATVAWIAAALSLPGVAALREAALCDLASDPAVMSTDAAAAQHSRLELFRGNEDAALVKTTCAAMKQHIPWPAAACARVHDAFFRPACACVRDAFSCMPLRHVAATCMLLHSVHALVAPV